MKLFEKNRSRGVRKNAFDLGHERKFSMNMGDLVPILCEEVVPGDVFKLNTELLLRLAPMVAPVMHRVNVFTHFFFVPNRLVWDKWEDFITGGEDGQEVPVRPYYSFDQMAVRNNLNKGSLADYLGVASSTPSWGGNALGYKLNAMPFRAYQTIYNEYYRDQNLEPKVAVSKSSGVGHRGEMALRKRAWEKDYFTAALPWTQRGGNVSLPMAGEANLVRQLGNQKWFKDQQPPSTARTGSVQITTNSEMADQDNDVLYMDVENSYKVDLSGATAATIEELRRATKLQRWLERNARSGSRYIEQIKSHFGVTSSDARLQRPEYLGGGKNAIVISEVLQTSSTDSASPQANMAGHGLGVGNSNSFKKSFEEHGYVIGIVSVLPRTAYMQGTRKHFMKDDKFDYYWPEFAQLGEQEVNSAELYDNFHGDQNDDVFGYQSRYAEYKFIPSSVHGDFKDSLKHWHMGREFASRPVLNNNFVKADPTNRIFAVTDPSYPKIYVQAYNNLKALRPMPFFNDPSLI